MLYLLCLWPASKEELPKEAALVQLQEQHQFYAQRTPAELSATQRAIKPLLRVSNLACATGFLKTGYNVPLPLVRWRENKPMLKINDCNEREINGLWPRMAAF